MKTRRLTLTLSALALAVASFAANADILFSNLGTGAPPATVGGHAMTPFDQIPQAAIPDYTNVTVIPGSPNGTLSISPFANKRTVPYAGWSSSWAHGYTGPVFLSGAQTATLTLPANTSAFYFYLEPDIYGTSSVTATTNSGTTSGAVSISVSPPGGADGATGLAFYSTAGEFITSITVTALGAPDFALGEFGIGSGPATTCASEGYTGTKLTWCRNICEMGYTGSTLATWLRRWINRFHDVPYCMREGGGEEPQPE